MPNSPKPAAVPGPPSVLRLRGRAFGPGDFAVMAVVNRTPDSFYDRGSTYAFSAAVDAASRLIADGADIVDIGGVKAGPGTDVDPAEEIRRVADVVAAVRERHPEVIISVDTWRSEVAKVVAEAGADLLNDTWGGVDPGLAEVAAAYGVGLVCAHAGRVEPRTRPHRIAYGDVVADVIAYTTALAERAVAAGVRRDAILIDPAHDFGKNTWHSLEVSRRLGEMTATGWPVLVAVSNKDFVGEALGGLPVGERHAGTLATLAVSALQGARVFRVHDAASARTALAVVRRLAAARS
ncbi:MULTISPECIES: dihydropteroate synthase [Microbispora]|uniref:dihydropteroate synthase n=1 Tax=Microbispora TaxID=2005 RepID=UPI0016002A5C|nr:MULTISPECIES: dihydropteroate synthase [Microbispora]MBO4274660.1 dihydropteroate synthase [Microbispora triticiradicis]